MNKNNVLGKLEQMSEKFDYCFSNPPYQDASNRPIFQHFQIFGIKNANIVSMIYMASRWWYGTSGLQDFRVALLANKDLKSVDYYNELESSSIIFPGTGIAGGISIVLLKEHDQTFFELFEHSTGTVVPVPHTDESLPLKASWIQLAEKVETTRKSLSLRNLHSPDMKSNEIRLTGAQLSEMHPIPTTVDSVVPESRTRVYANLTGSKGGSSGYYLIDKLDDSSLIHKYKVCMGQSLLENENRNLRLFVFDKETHFGRSAVSLKLVDTEVEALNFKQYAETLFFEKCLRLSLSGRMKTLGDFVPDLGDYTNNNPIFKSEDELPEGHEYNGLDFDHRLYKLFKLTDDEIAIVEGK